MSDVVTTYGGQDFLLDGVSGLSWSTGWPYGCLDASFAIDFPVTSTSNGLRIGADVSIWDGPTRVFNGFISEANPGAPWEIHVLGYYALALGDGGYLALAADLSPTSIPSVAVDQAITRGWGVVNAGTLPPTAFSSANETINFNRVGDLLNAYTAQIGQRWKVDSEKRLTVGADPTTPRWILPNTEALRGTADDQYVTDIYSRYVSALTSGVASAWAVAHAGVATQPAGRREYPLDLTNLGYMGAATAQSKAAGRLALSSARMGYTSPLDVAFGELRTPGDTPARLGHVKAGEMFQAFTVADFSGATALGMTQNVVIGRTDYTDGASTISLTPVDFAPRTAGSIWGEPDIPPSEQFDGAAA